MSSILKAVAKHFNIAADETSENILHWRERLGEKYTELQGICQYHDFVMNRNANGNAQLQV